MHFQFAHFPPYCIFAYMIIINHCFVVAVFACQPVDYEIRNCIIRCEQLHAVSRHLLIALGLSLSHFDFVAIGFRYLLFFFSLLVNLHEILWHIKYSIFADTLCWICVTLYAKFTFKLEHIVPSIAYVNGCCHLFFVIVDNFYYRIT